MIRIILIRIHHEKSSGGFETRQQIEYVLDFKMKFESDRYVFAIPEKKCDAGSSPASHDLPYATAFVLQFFQCVEVKTMACCITS